MAKSLPDALRLRELKYGAKTTAQERSRVAREFLAVGRTAEALDLFLIAGDAGGTAEIREQAIREGRPSLLLQIERGGHPVGAADWKRAADAALAAERFREAFRCYHRAGDEDGMARVREKLPDYDIYVPQGK
jgi:hypothetical protein